MVKQTCAFFRDSPWLWGKWNSCHHKRPLWGFCLPHPTFTDLRQLEQALSQWTCLTAWHAQRRLSWEDISSCLALHLAAKLLFYALSP